MPAYPQEKVAASRRRYRMPQTFSSPGLPYASGILPLPIGLIGASGMGDSRAKRSTRASICWLDSRKRSRDLLGGGFEGLVYY